MDLRKFCQTIKPYFPWILLLLSLSLNYFLFNQERVVYKESVVEVPVKVASQIKEESAVIVKPKEKESDADLVVKTKQDLKVSLNGKEVSLKPKEKESFEFGKDYAELHHDTSFTLELENKPLEPSWGIGIGYNNNKKLQGIVTARIRKTPMHVWVTSDGSRTAGGVMFSVNYK